MAHGLPTKDELLTFLREAPARTGKREIARAFKVKGADRIRLKEMLAELADEGLIARGARRTYTGDPANLPPVTIVDIVRISVDGDLVASPHVWEHADITPPAIVFAAQKKGDPSLGVGDRVLAKLRALDEGDEYRFEAKAIRKLSSRRLAVGVFRKQGDGGRIQPVDKKESRELQVSADHVNDALDGELVQVEVLGGARFGLPSARVRERIGDVGAPRTISLIAIHEHGIETEFSEEALEMAANAQPITSLKGRDDLRDVPFVTIDPEDARDHDDAVYAQPDDDPANEGGHILWIAIADVAHYVRPGTVLDREARSRGNSAYFPDRVVPMLPDSLSGDLCSLHEGVERPCIGVRIVLDRTGRKRDHAFFRALMRSAGSLTYEDAQAMADGTYDGPHDALREGVVEPLYAAYRALVAARERRQPLDLDLPERRVILNEDGEVESIRLRERLDAHRLIEECMVLANVCAAETLEEKRTDLVYRVHEPPLEERIESLRETVRSIGLSFAKGQRIAPSVLNRALREAAKTEFSETVSIAVLRAQTQAYYGPDNLGHFGLNLARYAHFTSPIRRYADLIVHRALISALGLGANPGQDGLTTEEAARLGDTATHISQTERRAMLAERDSTDRYLAAYMEERIGADFEGLISGVARFGLFVKLDETGADGLVPISSLGDDYYHHDAETGTLTGERGNRVFRLGQRVTVRLEEAVPLTGGLRFTLLDGGAAGGKGAGAKAGRKQSGRGKGPPRARRGRGSQRPRG